MIRKSTAVMQDAAMYSAACVGADETVAANRFPGCPEVACEGTSVSLWILLVTACTAP